MDVVMDDLGHSGPLVGEREDIEALRSSPVLSQISIPNLERLLEISTRRIVHPGETLFREGELTSRLYLIRSGVVHIVRQEGESQQPRPVAQLKKGDVLCDVGLFTGVRHRSSAIAVESVEVLTIGATDVRNLFKSNDHLAHQFASGLAHALTATRTLLEATKGTRMTLKGSLNGVDLLGLVHTLASCEDLAGHIVIHDDRHDTVGEITIKDASIVAASAGRIRGDEGFHELMLSAPATGGFSFREAGRDTGSAVELPNAISTPTAQLVLEAMRIKDELKWFREVYGLKGTNVQPAPDAQLEYEGPDLGIAMKVWNELQCGRNIAELLKGGTMMRELKLYGVLRRMIASGQAMLKKPPPTSEPD